jgi:N6-L-threonylcarbamoyladenine synthase
MICLGIETSCDETSVGIVSNKNILANLILSQEKLHRDFGGIMPEIASRAHIETIGPLLAQGFKDTGISANDIDVIGVANRPGLKGSLLVGVAVAAGFSWKREIPFYPVNHLHAHLAANFIHTPPFPAIGLLVSGGHTSLYLIKDYTDFSLIGTTQDDACGETFDKVGRMLNLPYPGGPHLERIAKEGDPDAIRFPVPSMKNSLHFSFSGLKTAVSYHILKYGAHNPKDIAASFQKTVGIFLLRQTKAALRKYKVKSLLFGGGVIQNSYLRSLFLHTFEKEKEMKIFIPEPSLCGDNGAVIALLTEDLAKKDQCGSPPQISVIPTKREKLKRK